MQNEGDCFVYDFTAQGPCRHLCFLTTPTRRAVFRSTCLLNKITFSCGKFWIFVYIQFCLTRYVIFIFTLWVVIFYAYALFFALGNKWCIYPGTKSEQSNWWIWLTFLWLTTSPSDCVMLRRFRIRATVQMPSWSLGALQGSGIGHRLHHQIWWNVTVGTKANERAAFPFDAAAEVEGHGQCSWSCVNAHRDIKVKRIFTFRCCYSST